MADVCLQGCRAVGVGEAGAIADEPGAGGELGDVLHELVQHEEKSRRGTSGRTAPRSGDPGRWPHKRWCITDADGRKRTIPTPQYDWEPNRLYAGTRTISARWRLALMGYPLHWLDVADDAVARLAGTRVRETKLGAWWNKRGIEMTGNSQCPQNVAVIARAIMRAGGAK